MITTRIRTLFVVGLVGVLLSVFTSVWYTNDSASAATTCTFKINPSRTNIGIACRSSDANSVPFKKNLSKVSSRLYTWTSPSGCKMSITTTSNTGGTHKTVDRLGLPATVASCPGVPLSQNSIKITQSSSEDPSEDSQQDQENIDRCEEEGKVYNPDSENPDKCDEACGEGKTDEGGKCVDGEKTSCAIDGIGWMICPVMNFIGDMNDRAYGFISETFLAFDPSLLTDADTQKAWESFRNIANIFFVLFFMIIIYSQLTSAGLSNYGIKRLLPRLVVVAVLVNISFFLCQIAVDISNIVGGSVVQLFNQGPFEVTASGTETTSNTDLPLWKDVIGGTLVLGTVAIALVLAVAIGLPGLLILAILVLALVMRKAIILMLVVIAPLALVAYLLPNTETWFKKWWKLFYTMLAIFPIIGVVFGASALAAKIINNGASGDPLIQLTALGVSVIPLFAIPAVLKTAMSGAGAIGAKISGGLSRAQGAAGSSAKGSYANSAFARGRALRKDGKDEYRKRQFARAVAGEDTSRLGRARRRLGLGAPGVTPGGEYSRNKLQSSALASVTATENKEYEEAVSAAKTAHAIAGISTTDLAAMAATGKDKKGQAISEHARAAAIDKVMSSGSFDERRSALEGLAGDASASKSLRARATEGAFAKGDNAFYGNGFGQDIIDGKITGAADLAAAAVKNAEAGSVTAEQWASSGAGADWLATVSAGSSTAKSNLRLADDAAKVPGTATSAKLMDKHISARSKL